MKVNELRVGNLVYDDEGFFSKVTGIKPIGEQVLIDIYHDSNEVSKGWMLEVDDLKPIPLTEEILLKCGFKRVPKNLYVDNLKDLRTAVTYLKGSIIWNESTRIVWVGNIALDNIKYLHELQNLYYAVENKELEVKL